MPAAAVTSATGVPATTGTPSPRAAAHAGASA